MKRKKKERKMKDRQRRMRERMKETIKRNTLRLMKVKYMSRSFYCDWHLSNLDSICKAIKNIVRRLGLGLEWI